MQTPLTAPLRIGGVEIANRVLLAPLAGIGNWFVRLQARRYGAGMAFSEMVSSFALKHRNRRTIEQMLVIHPDEHPVSIQLFGHDPEAMRVGAGMAAAAGADLIDINMGCPVKKVVRTGAGAALLSNPGLAVELARAAAAGSGLPVSVKLRSGLGPDDHSGLDIAVRLVDEAGVAAVALHPRPAAVHHKGPPDYKLLRELVQRVDVPVILSGGLRSAAAVHRAYRESHADAVMIARGSLGNPWIFGELTDRRDRPPGPAEIAAELIWVIDRAEEHLGGRAAHYLRKHYPWYLGRLGIEGSRADPFQRVEDLDRVRRLVLSAVGQGEPDCSSPRARELVDSA
jgi:nifR3 family TIM-barrel protein